MKSTKTLVQPPPVEATVSINFSDITLSEARELHAFFGAVSQSPDHLHRMTSASATKYKIQTIRDLIRELYSATDI